MRVIYVGLGFFFCALGAVGVVLPVLPTTPFLLLASFFFAKGSKRFNTWFLSTSLYRNHLDDFVKNRAMSFKTKAMICGFATVMLLIALIATPVFWARILIVCVIVFKYYYFIFRIKTIPPQEEAALKAENAEKRAREKAAARRERSAATERIEAFSPDEG